METQLEQTYDLWVTSFLGRSRRPRQLLWGNRELTADECIEEIKIILNDYLNCRFNPWFDDHELSPLANDVMVKGIPAAHSLYYYNCTFGFFWTDTARWMDTISPSSNMIPTSADWPFFFCGFEHPSLPVPPELLRVKLEIEGLSEQYGRFRD